jgi:hypothetical protein
MQENNKKNSKNTKFGLLLEFDMKIILNSSDQSYFT